MRQTLFFLALVCAPLGLCAADRTLSYEGRPSAIYFSADSKTAVAGSWSGGIRAWDVGSGDPVKDKTGLKGTFLLSSSLYAVIDEDNRTVAIWNLAAESRVQLFKDLDPSNLAVSHDANQLAISSEEAQTTEIWNLATGERNQRLQDGAGAAATLVFSPNDRALVSSNYDNDIRMWNTKTGELIAKVGDPTGAMFGAEFTPDGKQLIVAGLDETVYIRDAKTLAVIRRLKGQGEAIARLAISPDGRTLVTSGRDPVDSRNPAKVVIWDLPSGEIRRVLQAAHPAFALAFSPDGKWLALTLKDRQISLLDFGAPAAK
jgi:tricorn protease-like protein